MTAHTGMLPLEFDPPPAAATGPPAIAPRLYQAEALDKITAAYRRGVTRQLVVLPTGTGKTVVFSHLIARRPGRALVLAHRDELIQQAAAKLAQVSGNALGIGIVKAKQNDTGARTVVASVQTLTRPGRVEQLGRFETVIVDEAHHSVADTYLDVLDRLGCMTDGGPLTAGFTATAQRTDKLGLGHVWQEITVPARHPADDCRGLPCRCPRPADRFGLRPRQPEDEGGRLHRRVDRGRARAVRRARRGGPRVPGIRLR